MTQPWAFDHETWRKAQRVRAAEPTSLLEALYKVAQALKAADRAIEDFYGYDLKLMTPDRAAQFEAIFPDKPPYFEIEPIATAIKAMADGWTADIEREEAQ